ncbi:hypothetical protein EGW08_012661 [Elysia chlorotica]|uniref:Ig-like domain-containing protein n=1 Tax=Elysia chlorotica TaxID=188477 RepID=A0A433TD85_ELYCH|nr:hypothetical protein EGW08_012661 [Elysia chlorotica]
MLFHRTMVIGPPWPEPVFLPRLLNVTARHGGRALLPCAVHYLGTRQVTWRRLGAPHFLSVGDMAWVKDPNVTPADEGTYECKISDKNELFRHIHLRVVGPPLKKKGIVLVSELFIDRSRSSDSGIYICRSTMGIKSKTVTVLFGDKSHEKRAFSIIPQLARSKPNHLVLVPDLDVSAPGRY